MDTPASYHNTGPSDEHGDPVGDAFGARIDRIKNAQEAFDLLIQVAGSEHAESVLIDALDKIHQGEHMGDRERVLHWYERSVA